jgi:hypothetical protein
MRAVPLCCPAAPTQLNSWPTRRVSALALPLDALSSVRPWLDAMPMPRAVIAVASERDFF